MNAALDWKCERKPLPSSYTGYLRGASLLDFKGCNVSLHQACSLDTRMVPGSVHIVPHFQVVTENPFAW
ncbi:hypothetical protein XENTR_v10000441 [Xenopus tropicalis]|nr:hypothetical protein XENTR_v10000441 [Xenopus tropicalis]KAE8629333.1 hypothetical protein XENTR_v10000441 [Xenopus tropicalis]KAE8629334.1 hypothetical protein XENTR_v10000441 [Xenopus tropicalis]